MASPKLPSRVPGSASALAALLGAPLVAAVRALVREELALSLAAPSAEWLPHPLWPFGSRRRNAELARSGRIDGVRREGKTWLARRSALDAFIASGAVPALEPANDTATDLLDLEIEAAVRKRARR